MVDYVLDIFQGVGIWAVIISVLLNILIAILGLIPSIFITTANILFFGFWKGTVISFTGEVLGAVAAFYLYRKGIQRLTIDKISNKRFMSKLIQVSGMEAFLLIFSLRLLPFVPSGLVTFVAAIGSVSMIIFVIASSIGKIPAMILEAASAYYALQLPPYLQVILLLLGIVLLVMSLNREKIKRKQAADK